MKDTSGTTMKFVSDANGVYVIGPRKGRCVLMVSLSDGAAFKIALGSNPTTTDGLFVPAAEGYFRETREDFGSALDGAFTVIAAAAGVVNVIVTESVTSR